MMIRSIADVRSLKILAGGCHLANARPIARQFPSPMHPRQAELREKYDLVAIAGEGDDFIRAKRLRTWVRSRFNHGWEGRGEWHALQILRGAARGRRYNCGYYSRALAQCCLAIGLPARELLIYRANADYPTGDGIHNHGHVVTEVYCRELAGWVVLDADANAHYTIDGRPAGSLELHRNWHDRAGEGVKQILEKPLFVMPEPHGNLSANSIRCIFRDFTRHHALDYYHHITARQPASLLKPFKRENFDAVWFTGCVPPPLALGGRGLDLDHHEFTNDPREYDWPLNQAGIAATMRGESPTSRIELRLSHSMPFFDHFELSVNRSSFARVPGAVALLELPLGITTIRARGVDCFGRPGHQAGLTLRLKAGEPKRFRKSKAQKAGA